MSLTVTDLNVAPQGKMLVQDVSLSVAPGEILAILGANGAGKSELVSAMAGMLPVASGTVMLGGQNLTNAAPNVIRTAGVAAVPEGHRVLTALSVDENLRAAGAVRPGDIEDNLSKTYARFPELAERKAQLAGTLSGGQQQMVAIGHALMAAPQYLIIDEMSLGLAPLIVTRLLDVIGALRDEGTGVILIEQFVDLALEIADHAVVLRGGEAQYAGPASELAADKALLDRAYFGEGRG
jgi:branched-chain amino acid transport system ATP-binding protein